MRNCWLYVVRCMGRLMGLKGSECILLNDRIDCCWLGNWCRSGVNQHLLEGNLVLLIRGWVGWPLRWGVVP